MVPPATKSFNSPTVTVRSGSATPYSDEVAQFETEQREAFGDHAAALNSLQRSARKTMTPDLIGRCSLMIADVLAAAAPLFAVLWISGRVGAALPDCLMILLVIPTCTVLGLYDRDSDLLNKTTFNETPRLLCAAMIVTMTTITLRNGLIGSQPKIATDELAVLSLTMFSALCVLRVSARLLVRGMMPAERILMIGGARDHRRLANALAATPGLKAQIVQHISTEADTGVGGLPRSIDAPDKLQLALAGIDVDRVVIGTGGRDSAKFDGLIRGISATGTKVSLQPQLFGSTRTVPLIENVGAIKLVNLRQPRFSPAAQKTKRAVDICGATLAIMISSPLFAVIAVAIKLDSRGPVFYRQKRIGIDGEPFEIIKFRTMRVNAESEKQQLMHLNETDGLFKLITDPRVTRIGKLLRKTSIDELPQLVNVVRGQMSLVGPRPLVPEEDRKITGWRRHRNTITPGMTGVWQLLGPVRIPMDEMVEIDYEYVTNWSLGTDMKILLQTVPHVLGRRGL